MMEFVYTFCPAVSSVSVTVGYKITGQLTGGWEYDFVLYATELFVLLGSLPVERPLAIARACIYYTYDVA